MSAVAAAIVLFTLFYTIDKSPPFTKNETTAAYFIVGWFIFTLILILAEAFRK